jgi:VAD1 Analog of StAR-related lipid transfer domain
MAAAVAHYQAEQEQHQQRQPLHHPATMNVETNLIEEDYEDDDDDDEKEQKDGNNTNNENTVVIIHHDDDENDQPVSSSSPIPMPSSSKTTRIRKRGGLRTQQQPQQQQEKKNEQPQPSTSSSSKQQQQPTVLLSPQQQQQPRRQRQRIVIQFDNGNNAVVQEEEAAAEENEQQQHYQGDENTNAVAAETRTAVLTASTSCTPLQQQQQEKAAATTSHATPAATAAATLSNTQHSSSSLSFFSTEWLVSASPPSSPITTTTTIQHLVERGEEEDDDDERPMSAPAALLLADENSEDGTMPSARGVCGSVGDHRENMSHGLRMLFHSESTSLLSLGGSTNKQRGKDGTEDDGSDDDSVQSTPYFETSDVAPIHWAQALTEHEVMVGLAVVAITISLAHPLLFLAGSLTALGTATAVGAGYDYVTEGPIGRCLGLTSTTTTGVGGSHRRNSSTSIPYDETTAAAAAKTTMRQESAGAAEAELFEIAPVSLLVDKHDISTTGAAVMDPRHSVSTTTTVTTHPVTTNTTNPRPDSARTSFTLMDVTANGTGGAEQAFPENWIKVHYPPLEHYLFGDGAGNDKNSSSSSAASSLHPTEFQGLDVLQFFNVFYSDKAPFTYMEFQKKRGDKDIVYGPWKELPPQGPLSMHPTSTAAASSSSSSNSLFPLAEVDYIDFQSRILTFKTKTNNSFLGPPYAATTKEQRVLIVNKKLAILEMKTTLADIPFCDRFHVLERYIIQAEKVLDPQHTSNNNKSHHHHYYHCRIANASCQVFFQKSCPFETQIRTRSYASIEDVTTAWCHMATQALLLAEKAKLDRQMAEQHQKHRQGQENSHEGFVDEKKENDNDAGSSTMLTREPSHVTNAGASQLSGSRDGDAVLDVDSIEVMRSPNSNHACVAVQDSHDHLHQNKGAADDDGVAHEIPDVVRIPTLSPAVAEDRIIDKKITTALRNLRPWQFKFRGRSSRPSSFVSSQSASTSNQHHQQQNDMGAALPENTST